ncbi:FAD-dependent oxidoreductase [Streptomyces sp. NPDC048479]|uniref:FAD-dependent oxidoreductase n=1 Tax=Streptomyces sp. NPDC048479 TaxID=3154725 RepID=UPI00342DB598
MLVVGGGPAGVAAATTAAQLGWRVVLAEARNHLGGQLALAGSTVARRALWHRWAGWAESELRANAVEVRVSTLITERDCVDYKRVVIATGARASGPPARSLGRLAAFDAWAVIAEPYLLPGSILIVDHEGEWSALDCAEVLATHGHAVSLTTAAHSAGHGLRRWEQEAYRARLRALGVRILTCHELVTGPPPSAPVLRHVPSGLVRPLSHQVGAIVFASVREPQNQLCSQLQGRPGIIVVGDAAAPRALEDAIVDGTQAVPSGSRAFMA